MNIQNAPVTEVSLSDIRQVSIQKRFTRGLLVKLNDAVAAPEDVENLLHPALLQGTNGSRTVEVMLAAGDAGEHTAWLKQFHKAMVSQLPEKGYAPLLNGKSNDQPLANGKTITETLAPMPAMWSRVGEAGRIHGSELLKALRHARHVLRAGLQNLAQAREEAVTAQRAFFQLKRHLHEVDNVLHAPQISLDTRGCNGMCKEDAAQLAAAKAWTTEAHACVADIDAQASGLLLREGGGANCLASEWAMYAQQAALKLRDLEEELWAGQLREEQAKLQSRCDSGGLRHSVTTPRSRLPYNGHWRHKVAL